MLQKFIQSALLLVVLFTTVHSYAQVNQAPDGIQFQALATDANGHPAAGRVIYVKDAIVAKTATGTIVYSETFKVTASSAGVFSIVLGKGTYASGVSNIANIDWSNGPFFLNLKIAIEPTIPTASWNMNNEYVDLGTSQFWSVPYALYAGNVKGADGKLNTSDTAAMLKPYFTAINLKANIESPTFTGTVSGITKAMVGLANVDNTSDLNKPISTATQTALDLKANATDVNTALALKVNITDVNTALALKANATDVTAALDLKVDKVTGKALSTNDYTTAEKTKLAAITGTNTGDQDLSALVTNTALALKANTTDVNTSLALKANTAEVTSQLATKENTSNKSVNITTDAASDTKYPSVKSVKTYVDAQVAGANIADADANTKGKIQLAGDLAGTAAAPTVPGLTLKAPLVSPTFTGTVTTDIINTGALSATSVTAPTYASAPKALSYSGSTINWDPAQGLNGSVTLTQNSTLSFTAAPPVGSYGTVVLTQDATGNRTITLPSINGVANKVLGSASTSTVALSTAANAKDILNFYFDGTICYWNIGQGYGTGATPVSTTTNLASSVTGTLPIANGGTGATTAAAGLTNLGAAPIASPTFTGSVTAPIYASTPQALTAGSTISWNPALGLNASVTLNQNSTLSFSTTPVVGSYGTVVLTQDATGNRTITLPTINGVANKVLGSASTSTVALSTAANAKDILNFYFDGTTCYWNIGQGYGTAASSSITNLATGVTGTLPVANGGTGATTLTGIVKGSGTSALTAAVAGTDYQAPITLTTTGTGAATLSGTTLTIPTYSLPIANITNLGGVKVGSNLNVDASGVLTANINAGTLTGTTLASNVVNSSLTSVGTLNSATVNGKVIVGASSAASASAVLEVSSTTQGFLPPRMTYAQKTAIVSPPQGLMIYCTNCGTNGEPEYFNGTSWVNMVGGTAASVPITLGSTHEGGKVFYIFQPNDQGYVPGETHGLIAAPSDIPSNAYRTFGCYFSNWTVSTALGTGAANTTTLLGCNETNFAAKLVDALTDGGKSDWYLPSKDELNLLYLNRNLVDNMYGSYWSSSQWAPWYWYAWYQNFSDGTQNGDDKNQQKGIRAIRSF